MSPTPGHTPAAAPAPAAATAAAPATPTVAAPAAAFTPRRRTVLVATAAASAAALVSGCGGGEDSPAGEATPEELARTTDIPVGGGKVFADAKVVVTQPEEGEFKAFSAICTHQRCTVGSVADGLITCPCHGSRFRVADASVAAGPATRPLPERRISVSGNSIRLA
ncbi:Rieske (2Fe-2S) protein [Streptomyces sp. NPDC047928]|uniref:Rieske (2Fe-2S) protein n=1 Tax=unclassified Streptomyces TaxID=2593676 RepID=UPI003713720B